MPMFHLNPLGYGVVGALTGGYSIIGWEKFSARNFWKSVKEAGVTVLMLHIPPVEILKQPTSAEAAAGHKVRISFCGDPESSEARRVGKECVGPCRSRRSPGHEKKKPKI